MGERAAALAFLLGSGLYLTISLSYPVGASARPGPGFFPVLVGAFLCLAAGCFVAIALRRPARANVGAVAPVDRGARQRVAWTAAGLVGYCLLLGWIGYPLVAFLFVALLLKRLGGGGWPGVLIVALVSAAVSYYLFGVLLAVPLPRGVLFD